MTNPNYYDSEGVNTKGGKIGLEIYQEGIDRGGKDKRDYYVVFAVSNVGYNKP